MNQEEADQDVVDIHMINGCIICLIKFNLFR